MELTIKGATVGFDKEGISNLMTDIQANVIQEAKDKLDAERDNLNSTLDEIWQGHSEEIFKQNMFNDIETLKKQYDIMYNALAAEISQLHKAMGDIDQNLVTEGGAN